MVKIAEIVTQNPWWRYERGFVEYDPHIKKAAPIFFDRKQINLKKGGIYVLRGPRQVGKTTYLKDTIKRLLENGVPSKNILYLSLDFFTSRREMRNGINYFLDLNPHSSDIFIFLDEIISVEDWNLELKYMADRGIILRGVVFATGSSAVKLKEKGELLPGRGIEGNEYYIKPISFREFVLQTIDYVKDHICKSLESREALTRLKFTLKECSLGLSHPLEAIKENVQKILPFKKELGYLFRIYLITGGMPGVINHYLSNRVVNKDIIEPHISEIFIRDVFGDLSRLLKQEVIIKRLLRAIIDRYGTRYSFTTLSREIERSHGTTIDYLEHLEDSFISFIFYPYDFNKKKPKLKGDKKVYFFDPFIFHSVKAYLTGEEIWNVINKTMEDEELQSKLVEGIVVSHILLHKEVPFLKTGNTFLWSYYDKSGKEIDVILKETGEYLGIEIKYGGEVSEKDVRRIAPLKRYIILSKEDVGGEGETLVIPADVLLALLTTSERNV